NENSNEIKYKIVKVGKQNTICATAIDFDNDNDLDIFYLTKENNLYLLKNNSKGQFKKYLNGNPICENVNGFICSGDFNNDGFVDLFLSSSTKDKNYFLLNDSGKIFIDKAKELGMDKPSVIGAISGDIDNDGDLDIFGIRNENNVLWTNKLDNRNWLIVKINCMKTPSPGYGTKIWIYDAGHLNENKYLKGFKQIGSDNPGTNLYSQAIAHFGVTCNELYDIKIRFNSGKLVVKRNIQSGKIVNISEYNNVASLWFKSRGKIIFLFKQEELYFHLLSFLLVLLIVFGSIKIGKKYFEWSNKIVISIIVTSISLFWILVNIFIDEMGFYKYGFPVVAILAVVIIPILSSFQFYFKKGKRLREETKEKLVNELQIFSHGEFAMSNINSLQLFYKNYSATMMENEEYKTKYLEYRNVFEQIVSPNIQKILKLCKIAFSNSEVTKGLNNVILIISQSIHQELLNKNIAMLLNEHLENLKQTLYDLKSIVYKNVSSETTNVVKYITKTINDLIMQNDVKLIREKDKNIDYWVLIKNYELADIIDNCIRNAIKRLNKRADDRQLEINIYKILPKIMIDIKDNGEGINKSSWEKIFESGVSMSEGTGMGLFHARKILEKYKGRIFVVESKKNKSTIIRIELLEGIQNETKIITN
ncbi:MAG: ATP-binding protein, partial [Candidatus Marinimicrobia bacterium]|nr:ATP-binding protein [Candidatus Neomarinimicrobiota bacterium]